MGETGRRTIDRGQRRARAGLGLRPRWHFFGQRLDRAAASASMTYLIAAPIGELFQTTLDVEEPHCEPNPSSYGTFTSSLGLFQDEANGTRANFFT